MRRSLDEREVQERFAKIYGLGGSEVMLSIERSVCGSDYGATSWTTLDEAGEVAAMLGLRPAGELISEGVLAVEMGATIKDLAESVHPHPTLSETLMEAAEVFYGHSSHSLPPVGACHGKQVKPTTTSFVLPIPNIARMATIISAIIIT